MELQKRRRHKDHLLQWLGGLTMQERLMTCEQGMLVTCVHCDRVFFDLESDFERSLTKCRSVALKHDCVGFSNYIILFRGFAGASWVVSYDDGTPPEQVVIDYFKRKKR
jgi:hypothetical protein